ncbi:hypothetical protein [Peribacillus muralis]|uniref:hypothetical protein n=1 Tax=Peribacillus muralis TaxID=264697 RepID=UPI00366D08A1
MERSKFRTSNCGNPEYQLSNHAEWNETEGARLLREMRVYVRPRRLKAEEAHGPPAERDRLQCNETFIVQSHETTDNRNCTIVITHICSGKSGFFFTMPAPGR